MAANTSPIFPVAPRSQSMVVVGASALTPRSSVTGTTGLTLCFTPGANGSRVDTIRVNSTGTTLAGNLNFWVYNGTTSNLLTQTLVTAVTASATAAGFSTMLAFTDLVIPTGYALYCSSEVASQLVNTIVSGGDY